MHETGGKLLTRMCILEARIMVPDARFDWLCDLYKPASKVPAALTCIDIAGLTAVRLYPSATSSKPLTITHAFSHRVLQLEPDWAMLSSRTSAL